MNNLVSSLCFSSPLAPHVVLNQIVCTDLCLLLILFTVDVVMTKSVQLYRLQEKQPTVRNNVEQILTLYSEMANEVSSTNDLENFNWSYTLLC